MFCTRCGKELRADDKFCFDCGMATARGFAVPPGSSSILTRPVIGRKIGGVCAGLARYLSIDVTLARIIAIVLLLWPVPFIGGLAYLIAMLVIPDEPTALPHPQPQSASTWSAPNSSTVA